jgi:hypothetical protein
MNGSDNKGHPERFLAKLARMSPLIVEVPPLGFWKVVRRTKHFGARCFGPG